MIEEEMFCEDLFEWIGSELKLPDRALKLKQLKKQNTDIKTIITVILCSADYYTETEIKGMLKTLDEVIGMPVIKRNCIRANNCLKHKQYAEAALEYEKIINSTLAAELTPEEYGNIYHNLAVAKIHITGLKEASRLFLQAYERNQREESLIQYLYTLRLCNNDALYQDKIEEYGVTEEMKNSIAQFLEQQESEAEYCEQISEIEHLKNRKVQGKMSEYYQRTDEIIASWKSKVRQI
jgi:tetratricopeptide (TPR) repeat protein